MKKSYFKYVLLVPALLLLAVTTIYPVVYAFMLSFREWKIVKSPVPGPFVGLDNYIRAVNDELFWNALKITLMYTGIVVAMSICIGLAIAILLQKPSRASQLIKPLLIFPFAVSPALKGYSFRFMLVQEYGVLDSIFDTLFPQIADLNWLGHPFWALFWMAQPEVWGWAGITALMFLGALGSISPEIFEAAKVDGATNWNLFWRITLPILMPVVLIVTLLKAIFSLRMFDLVRTMTAGGPGRATETLNFYIYQVGFNFFDMGYSAALAILLAVLLCIFAYFYARALLGGAK